MGVVQEYEAIEEIDIGTRHESVGSRFFLHPSLGIRLVLLKMALPVGPDGKVKRGRGRPKKTPPAPAVEPVEPSSEAPTTQSED